MEIAKRYTVFPIVDEVAYKFWKLQDSTFWFSNELKFLDDREDYRMIKEKRPDLRRIVDLTNAFFSATDGIVVENIAFNLLTQAETPEERGFYISQMHIESVHAEVYSLIINTFVADDMEREEIFRSADRVEAIRAKNEWLLSIVQDKEATRLERLLVFACAEGIFFTAAFMFVFFFKSLGKLKNMVSANAMISKDERLHRDAAIAFYNRSGHLSEERAHEIVRKAVELEMAFVEEVIPLSVEENGSFLSQEMVKNYVKCMGNSILRETGYSTLWEADISLIPSWMDTVSQETKENFYEVMVTSYSQTSDNVLDHKSRYTDTLPQGELEEDVFLNPDSVQF